MSLRIAVVCRILSTKAYNAEALSKERASAVQPLLLSGFAKKIKDWSIVEGLTRSKTLAALKKQYDGYLFAKAGVNVYNPFSLLSALKAKDFGSYWFSTGTPTFLVNYLKETHYFIPDLDGNIELNEAGLETYRANIA